MERRGSNLDLTISSENTILTLSVRSIVIRLKFETHTDAKNSLNEL